MSDSGSAVHRDFCGKCSTPLASFPDLLPGVVFVKVSFNSTRRLNVPGINETFIQVGAIDRATEIKPKAEICPSRQGSASSLESLISFLQLTTDVEVAHSHALLCASETFFIDMSFD